MTEFGRYLHSGWVQIFPDPLLNEPYCSVRHFNSTLCTVWGCRWIALFLTVQMNPSQWQYPQSSFNGNVEKGDSPSKLVRIQRRVSRKRYLGSKYTYEYERLSLDIPRKLHDKVKPFLKQNLDMDVSIKGSYLIITLTPAKTTKSTTATTEIFRLSGWDEID